MGSPRSNSDVVTEKAAPLACTECRRKHAKCDANMPVCLRCMSAGVQCHYLPSRRGLKRRAASYSQHMRPNPSPPGPQQVQCYGPGFVASGESSVQTHLDVFPDQAPVATVSLEEPQQYYPVEDDEALINLFYANFHAAHPILVPRTLYTTQAYPAYLKLVVHFLGSHFSTATSSDTLRSVTASALAEAGGRNHSFHLVQALLLFSIALHARNEIPECVSMLAQAVSLALELGMHRKSFSEDYGRQSAIQEESLRRTWWELYVTDGFMAALQRKSSFDCHTSSPDVPLPCEESLYVEGSFFREPPSLAEFDARMYAPEETHYSSFCYRIEAVRVLARVLSIAWTHDVHEDQVRAIDNALAAWPHHLDVAKTDAATTYGGVDEMLFQAHMLIHYSTIYLHFPRSDLVATLPGASNIIRQQHLLPVSTRNMHGIKALEASKQLANLAAIPTPMQKHSPFFICGIVFCVLVQLSACSLPELYNSQDRYRDSISLITGVLRTLSPTWALAQVTLRKIKNIALETLFLQDKPVTTTSPHDSGVDLSASITDLQISDLLWIDALH
ncbi:hypothetical protein UA08_04935 [Talaromyces atroroseus]|uniref:Zn(2)-C6 fungal-type domain-containing protein n=1 Tax=Talaromyces atroroseus TaxID=1441469 RepID=A0A225AGW0_TALAT|nr:hypothetical protein UA08_04935 [Talaromyces atroroseus]OKL59950.1 hypothetical protein UA08_04935 [Talaromyces atroroseus]